MDRLHEFNLFVLILFYSANAAAVGNGTWSIMEALWGHPLTKMVLVMMGGGLGSLSRYGITLLSIKLFGARFPWGTLIVNLTGCFLIGLSFALAERSTLMNSTVRLFFITGFLGGLTTFSTYGYESFNAIYLGNHWLAIGNVVFNNVAGLILVFLGFRLGSISG
jgi:CrcB protein